MIGMVLTLMLVAFKFVPQSFPGLSPYPLASVNSPPDGGFPTQTHHQHPAAEPDGGYNDPGFNHLAEPGNGGHSQGGGGDGYHQQQQDSSYPQVGLGTLSKKNYGIIWEFFPYRGGRVFPIPKTFVN